MGNKTVETTASGLSQAVGRSALAPLATEEITELGTYFPKSGGGGGGTSDYDELTNKPSINSVTLSGNKTTSDLGIDEVPNITSNDDGKVLTATYNEGTGSYAWGNLSSTAVTNALSTAQQNAINSGITSEKVTTYDTLPDEDDVKDIISAHFVAGTNVTITDNVDGTQTIASTGGGSSVAKFTRILEGTNVTNISQLRDDDYSDGLFVCQGTALNPSGGPIYVFAYKAGNEIYQYLTDARGGYLQTQCKYWGTWSTSSVKTPSLMFKTDAFTAVTPSITGATITNIGGGYLSTNGDQSLLSNICFVNIWFDIDDASLLDGQDLNIWLQRIKPVGPSTDVCTTLQMTAIGTNTDSKGVCYILENGKMMAGYNSFSGNVRICISGSYIVNRN